MINTSTAALEEARKRFTANSITSGITTSGKLLLPLFDYRYQCRHLSDTSRVKKAIFLFLYAGPDYVGGNSQPNIKSAIHSLGASYADHNGDGEVVVNFTVITHMNNEQIAKANEKNTNIVSRHGS